MGGKGAVQEGVAAFWHSILGLTYRFVNVVGSCLQSALEAMIDYVRTDGRVFTIPCVTMLTREGNLVGSLRV